MATACTVCSHPKSYDINACLLQGQSHQRVANKYGLSKAAVGRHWRDHIPAAMHEAAAAQGPVRIGALEGEVLLGQAVQVYERALETLDSLERKGMDQRARVAALREVRMALETLAKLSFTVQDRGQAAPESAHLALDSAIIDALAARGVKVDSTQQSYEPAAPMALPVAST